MTLIDPADEHFSIAHQCVLLGLAGSSYYYRPLGESPENLALMERIDKLFTARPEMGVRRMHQELITSDNPAGTPVNAIDGAGGPWAETQPIQAPAGPYHLSLPIEGLSD